jgi:hypothetical protein
LHVNRIDVRTLNSGEHGESGADDNSAKTRRRNPSGAAADTGGWHEAAPWRTRNRAVDVAGDGRHNGNTGTDHIGIGHVCTGL